MYENTLSNLVEKVFFGFEPGTINQFESFDGKTHELALPGFSKEDLTIEIDGRVLKISAEIKESKETKWRKSFSKRFTLPNEADIDTIKATMENGVLSLTFGKNKEAKKINIL